MAANDLSYTNSASTVLNLNDGSTYKLRAIRGIYNDTAKPVSVQVATKTPPEQFQAYNRTARTFEADLLVYGSSYSNVVTNLAALGAHFAVDARGDGLGTLTYTSWANNQRSIRCGLAEPFDDSKWIPAATKAWTEVTLKFYAPDPTFWNPTAVTGASAFNGATPVNLSCANTGNLNGYLTLTYTGTATATVNPKVTDAYGHWVELEGTVSNGDVVVMVLDPSAISVLYTPSGGSATNWWGKRSATSTMVYAKYGTNNLVFSATSGTATIATTFYPRHSQHG
ncbi:MAG: hypothetical protein WC683_07980 [bacterium]